MDEQLDDNLKKHIAEVFENYEDASADEGWLLLREKFPEENKRRIAAWIWWASAAAILLLFLGILWFRPTPDKPQQQTAAINKTKPAPQPNTVETKTDTVTKVNPAVQQHGTSLADNRQSGKSIPKNIKHEPPSVLTPTNNNREAIASVNQNKINQPANSQDNISPKSNSSIQNPPSQGKSLPAVNAPQNSTSIVMLTPTKKDTANTAPAKPQTNNSNPGTDMLAQKGDKGNKNTFADNTYSSHKTAKLSNIGKVQFGVYATTYFNYAKGSSSQFNVGGGISSDIPLSGKLKLSTGLSIGQNTLNYANQPPAVSSFSAPSAAVTLSSYLPASLNLSGPPSFKNYNANLVGLDVPLNLKYYFNPKKSETYILAGFSSGTFINETYTYSYRNPSFFSANISQIQDQSTRNSFNGFYFAKTLNFALGTGYTVGGSRLIVEPFFKYPIDGLGTQQIKFGSGGINLKFSFQPSSR